MARRREHPVQDDQGRLRLVGGAELGEFGQLPPERVLVELLATTDHQRSSRRVGLALRDHRLPLLSWPCTLNSLELAGLLAFPAGGVALPGLRLRVTDRQRYDPAATAVALLVAIRAAQRDSLRFNVARFDQLAAGPALRRAILAGRSVGAIARAWQPA